MKNYKLLLIFILFLFLAIGCKKNKDRITTDSSASLSFSQTNISFDTIFSSVGSITKRLWVYNNNIQGVNISSIYLAGQNTSPFTMIVDGEELIEKENFILKGLDSMQILIKVQIDPQNNSLAYLVEDSIVFLTNGNVQDVDLIAYGQDAVFITNTSVSCGETWINTKPFVIQGTVTVPLGCTLTIEKGTRVYFHKDGKLVVDGTILSNGEKDSLVIFRQANLSNFYKNVPGQWEGIVIQPGSKNNRLTYSEISNAVNSITLNEELDGDTIAELVLENTTIKNSSKNAVTINNSDFYAVNCLFANTIGNSVRVPRGGNVYLDYCTVTCFSYDFFRDGSLIYLSNQEGAISNSLEAKFRNVIVYGDKSEEIEMNDNGLDGFSFTSYNSLLKTLGVISGSGNLLNTNPRFESESGKKFFLKADSPAIDMGYPLATPLIDIEGTLRDLSPDIGCYEL